MSHIVKFASLPKAELEYEILIRNETPASTVVALRKQITPLAASWPSEEVLVSPLEIMEDLNGIADILSKIKTILESAHNAYSLLKAENLLSHLFHRLGRVEVSELGDFKDLYDGCMDQYHNFCGVLSKLGSTIIYRPNNHHHQRHLMMDLHYHYVQTNCHHQRHQ